MLWFLTGKVYSVLLCCTVIASAISATCAEQTRSPDTDESTARDSHVSTFWGYNPLTLLNEEAVRKELGVSRDQAETLDQLVNTYLDTPRPIALEAKEAAAMPTKQRAAVWMRLGNQQRDAMHKFSTRALESLTESQKLRLAQVALQLRGVKAFFLSRIVESLGLNPSQRQEIASVRSWLITEARRLRASTHPKWTDSSLGAKQWKEARQRIIGILTEDQLRLLDRLGGQRISFSDRDLSMVLRQRDNSRVSD